MKFISKPFKLGNSKAVYIPKEIWEVLEDKQYEFEVREIYTNLDTMDKQAPVYTPKPKFSFNEKKGVWENQ